LNLTLPSPWLAPKFVPVIVTGAPTAPDDRDRLVTVGVANTVNVGPVTFTPLALTTTAPVVALAGTVTWMLPAPQLATVAGVPLNLTLPSPWLAPKFVPVIVTGAPTAPDGRERLVTVGVANTVNVGPVISTPLALTTTAPVAAPDGTVTWMLPAPQLVTVADVPLNLTLPSPSLAPKFVPVIVTGAPTAPDDRERLVTVGVANTVNVGPVTFTPLALTTTAPVAALAGTVTWMLLAPHVRMLAGVPLNLTLPLPWLGPKFVPVIVTSAPTAPDVRDRPVTVGVGNTVKLFPLLSTLLTRTTTLPVVAPAGTVTTMLPALQLLTFVTRVPLNLTVLVPFVDPKPLPAIVTVAPTAPDVGVRVEIVGAAAAAAGSARTNRTKSDARRNDEPHSPTGACVRPSAGRHRRGT
jgi:hypothetical protein